MSEKLDGVFGYWDGKALWTKQGNPISPPDFWLEDFPPFALYGELWLDYNAFEETLSIISSAKNKEKWSAITFNVFEVQNVCEKCSLHKRLEVLERYLQTYKNPFIKIIPQIPIKDQAHLDAFNKEILKKGGEGVILRKDSIFQKAYKLKPF